MPNKFLRLSGGLIMAAALLPGSALAANATASRSDATIESKVTKALSTKSAFHNVEATTEDGIVTLSGTTELYQQKLDAAKKVRHTEHVAGVRNLIEVSGTNISDDELRHKLARKLTIESAMPITLSARSLWTSRTGWPALVARSIRTWTALRH